MRYRNPYRTYHAMRHALDHMMAQENNWSEQDSGPRYARLPLDVYETKNELVVTANVAGVDPETVEITLEDNVLSIQGHVPAQIENVDYLFNERFHGNFGRRIALNVAIDVDNIEATFEDGVLTLLLPKAEEARPRTIPVKIKDAKK